MRILFESYQDVEDYLRSPGFQTVIQDTFGDEFYNDPDEICSFIQDEINEQFQMNPPIAYVTIYKIVNEEFTTLESDRPVIEFNGYWYDFCAQEFNESFDGQITINNVPVIQKMIYAENLLDSRVSSIRGYAMLGEFE